MQTYPVSLLTDEAPIVSITHLTALSPPAPGLAEQCHALESGGCSCVWHRASRESQTLYQGTPASQQHSAYAGSPDEKQTLPGCSPFVSHNLVQENRTEKDGTGQDHLYKLAYRALCARPEKTQEVSVQLHQPGVNVQHR